MWARFLRQFALLFIIFVSLSGCGTEEPRKRHALGSGDLRWTSFPIPVRADELLLDGAEAEEDLLAAIAFWESRARKNLFTLGTWPTGQATFSGSANNPDNLFENVITFLGPWPFENRIAGKTVVLATDSVIQKSVIFLNGGTSLCSGLCSLQDSLTSRRKLLAHELGHFLGLAHVDNRNNVMFPEILPGGSLDYLDIDDALLIKLTSP